MSDIKRVFGIVTAVFVLLLAVPFISVSAEGSGDDIADWTYFSQIDDDGKKIYNAAAETFDGKDVTDSIFTVSGLGMVMVKTDDGSVDVMMDRVMSSVRAALTAAVLDDPLAYWCWPAMERNGFIVDPNCVKEFEINGTKYLSVTDITVTMHSVNGGSDMAELRSKAADVQKTVDGFKTESKDTEGILADINKYLVDNLTLDNETKSDLSHTVYSALGSSDKITTSEGYAQAFKTLCDEHDIQCTVIIGDVVSESGSEPWMWNSVDSGDGKWFAYDTAMNDKQGNESYSMCGYKTVCSDGYPFAASHQVNPGRVSPGLANVDYPDLQDKVPDPEQGFVDKYGAQILCIAIGAVIIIALFDMARRMGK